MLADSNDDSDSAVRGAVFLDAARQPALAHDWGDIQALNPCSGKLITEIASQTPGGGNTEMTQGSAIAVDPGRGYVSTAVMPGFYAATPNMQNDVLSWKFADNGNVAPDSVLDGLCKIAANCPGAGMSYGWIPLQFAYGP